MGEIICDVVSMDDGVAYTELGQLLTLVSLPSMANQPCYVLLATAADNGVYVRFDIPQQGYGTAPQMRLKGFFSGAPSAGDDLGFGMRKRAIANNESADGTFDPEETTQNTDIGAWADEDMYEAVIPLTAADYQAGDQVGAYVYVVDTLTNYGGQFLLTSAIFEFTDA